MSLALALGAGACYAGSAACAVALLVTRRRASAEAAPSGFLHVSEIEAVEPYEPYESGDVDAAEFHYCPAEFRVTAHAVQADGTLRCWHCDPIEGEA